MGVVMEQDEIETRKQLGRLRAMASGATEPKSYGQTSPEVYPYTYWWIVGYNEIVGV